MMMDLFSAMDANQYGVCSVFAWLSPMLVVLTFLGTFTWVMTPPSTSLVAMATYVQTTKKYFLPIGLFLFTIIFFVAVLNLTGLIPLVYGCTSSLWVASSLAITIWLGVLISGWIDNPKESAAHLAPSGAPSGLMPFLILIETVSVLIRPLTLTVRLIANISAGHIVMGLIANCLSSIQFAYMVPFLLINVFYTMFEVFVCFIQAYIFSLLIKLYVDEHP
uniref:ATP synthase subunit a n=1 Tax=Ascobulla fragilis TaxID=195875 RepID=B3DFC2_ASCFR|nr:ATP synthase F0 subunit 6 [Ascobulla fragilis]ACE62809.1 ATP synthase F0 subunit 6 [Ascobulla fragilis]